MTNEEAKRIYAQAVGHVDAGAYNNALALLDELDSARPNSRYVTYQRARCLAALGRADEAEECCRKLGDRIDSAQVEQLRAQIAATRGGTNDARPTTQPSKTATSTGDEDTANIFVVETVYPVATDQTTVTGQVKSGVIHTGDTLTIVSPEGTPLLAPVERIGTAETPLNLVRAGQKAVLLLSVEPHHVAPGMSATCAAQEESYAETMVVSSNGHGVAASALTPELKEVERRLRQGHYAEAKAALDAALAEDPNNAAAHRLLARVQLESDGPERDPKRALESIRKAYELGGAQNPAVIDTLAQALAANGEAQQGLRFLERLYSADLPFEARVALGQRISEYRATYNLGHVWEFADAYGDVIFEATEPAEIVKALENKTVPRDAKCRKDHIGEWRNIEDALVPEYPEIAVLYARPQHKSHAALLAVVFVVAALAVGAAVVFIL